MKVHEVTNEKEWDILFKEAGHPSFLQMWEWGEFHKLENHKTFRLGVYKGDKLIAAALAVKISSRRGTFIFVPHGPIILPLETPPLLGGAASEQQRLYHHNILSALKSRLIQIAEGEKCAFIRVASTLPDSPENRDVMKSLGFVIAPIYMHSERVWLLPLRGKTEDELLAGMRKTTRYLIRRGAKDGVTVELRRDDKAIDDFWEIYKETVGLRGHLGTPC